MSVGVVTIVVIIVVTIVVIVIIIIVAVVIVVNSGVIVVDGDNVALVVYLSLLSTLAMSLPLASDAVVSYRTELVGLDDS